MIGKEKIKIKIIQKSRDENSSNSEHATICEGKNEFISNHHLSQAQDTGKFRANTKDQFYTNVDVAKNCIEIITSMLPYTAEYLWVEPSAGNGSFLHNVPAIYSKVGIDIDPKSPDIIKQDYLSWDPSNQSENRPLIVFGNPPFGRQSSLVKKFIKKSCKFANVIAFILPRSFMKPSMSNVFDLKFHCIYSNELGKNSFIIDGSSKCHDVPCVFQIWIKKNENRIIEEKIVEVGFKYVKVSDQYDIAFRRVGGLAGKCYPIGSADYSAQSHYFLKFDENVKPYMAIIMDNINHHFFPSNTVGPRSLSKSEVNMIINDIIVQISS